MNTAEYKVACHQQWVTLANVSSKVSSANSSFTSQSNVYQMFISCFTRERLRHGMTFYYCKFIADIIYLV